MLPNFFAEKELLVEKQFLDIRIGYVSSTGTHCTWSNLHWAMVALLSHAVQGHFISVTTVLPNTGFKIAVMFSLSWPPSPWFINDNFTFTNSDHEVVKALTDDG